jgi:hypothetical protein
MSIYSLTNAKPDILIHAYFLINSQDLIDHIEQGSNTLFYDKNIEMNRLQLIPYLHRIY